ncbi:MAG: hypothetical protein DGJ47_000186 [Rickettsiaceae bacterium]
MKPLIIFNWKMNLGFDQTISLTKQINSLGHSNELIIAPSGAYLGYLAKEYSSLTYCSQDVSIFNNNGSYTGESSAAMVKSCNIHYSLVGHSERRSLMLETNKAVSKKLQNCIESGITPIFCVGETIESRKSKNHFDFIEEQLKSLPSESEKIIIAYEPIWSIGTGVTPKLEEIQEIINFIKKNKYVASVAKNIRLVYGGSVNADNIQEILKIEHLDGVLVGSASLKPEEIKLILDSK